MNLAEALLAAPELPVHVVTRKNYKLNPDVVVREELNENGELIVVIYVPEKAWMVKFTNPQYELLLLFNGERGFAEVSEAYREQSGYEMSDEDLRAFAQVCAESGLWYVSAQERNITLSQKLSEERRKRIKKKSKWADLSHIVFQGFNPDAWLERMHKRLWWIYTPWVSGITACFFVYMIVVWYERWAEVGRDTLLYYTFTQKTIWDIAEFWLLFLIVAFLHESAHGLTCKHFGARVPNMGFQLIYLAPAFATEITEIWVRAGRRERIWAIVAGIWMEGILCAGATVLWVGTPPGSAVHEWSYKVMLITGIITLLVNLNPLIKLDGYYLLSEVVGIGELKENATAYVTGWIKRNVFRLPVEYECVPFKRRLLYVPYGVLSSCYSYVLLFAVARFTYNVFSHWFGDWAFLPAGLVAWKIFRSRILLLRSFMKTIYLDKRDSLLRTLTPKRLALGGTLAAVILLVPMFRKTSDARFVLEPMERAVVRAQVPAYVERVFADENSHVTAGMPLVQMRNADIETAEARAQTDLAVARSNRMKAQLVYASLGPSASELKRAEDVSQSMRDKVRQLQPVAPIDGTVTTPHVHDLQGVYVAEGALLMEIENTQRLRARLYVPEYQVRDLRLGHSVSLHLDALWRPLYGVVDSIAKAPSTVPDGLMPESKYKGLKPPSFYLLDVMVQNPGNLRSGMSGDAKVFLRRQNLLAMIWENVHDFASGRVW